MVLDPIFLLTPEYWQKEFWLVKTQEKYVLLYNIQHSKNAYKLAHFIAKIIWGRVIEITWDILLFNSNKDILHNAGPVDFLQLVYDSEFIISTSFHGVAFAILFEKQFFVLNMNENANRVTDLLKLISLEERYIWETENIEDLYKKEQIDYNQVKEKLNILRRKSIDFLLRNLSDK